MKTKNEKAYSPLELIIQEVFIESEFIIQTVRKYEFEAKLYPGLKKTTELIESKDFESIPNIVGALLTTINDKLKKVKDKEKEILENLSIDLFTAQISILNQTEEGKICWQKCIPILKDTCDFKGYDFQKLSALLKFDFIKQAPQYNVSSKEILPYYEWLGNKNELDELIQDIKSKNWIENVREFKRLFAPIQDSAFSFQAKRENIEKLLVLFSKLKDGKFLITRKNKGHFLPLEMYGMDLDKKLFENKPKRYHEQVKRKDILYQAILKEVNKLIDGNLIRSK